MTPRLVYFLVCENAIKTEIGDSVYGTLVNVVDFMKKCNRVLLLPTVESFYYILIG